MLKKDIKRNKLSCRLMTAYFVGFIAVFSLGTFLTKDRSFSEMENRTLKQKPDITAEKVFSGEFGTAFEDYMGDQIIFKDGLMSVKTTSDFLIGKSYQNGVYFSQGGYLLQRFDEDRQNLDTNIAAINEFAESRWIRGKKIDMMLVPNSICVNADKLPAGAVTDDQRDTISHVKESLSPAVTLFDPTNILMTMQREGKKPYYRTDHHWTSPAAKLCLEEWLGTMGVPLPSGNYELREVGGFYGTMYSKAPAGFIRPDKFGYYFNGAGRYGVEYVIEGKSAASMIDESFLTKKDKYASFFGGNFAHLVIRSGASGGKVLVLKDSYANAALPLLADVFSEIHVVDLRYFHTDTVTNLIDLYGIDRIMLLYNVDFLNEDKNFVWLG
ncbi:MAG: hypothetical protein K6B74_02945 [Ruminococcus sp.]|nr:hypothetical protein [Ruminococcus sp.]